jgi:hypothetical protein
VESLGSRDAGGPTPEPGTIDSIVDDASSNLHGLMELPNVSADGEHIAVARFTDDFVGGTHATVLRVYEVPSGAFVDVVTGTQTFSVDATGAGIAGETLSGTPIWGAGVAWPPGGAQLFYLSPGQADGPTRWTLHSVPSAGGGPATVVLEGISSFDLGYLH